MVKENLGGIANKTISLARFQLGGWSYLSSVAENLISGSSTESKFS